MFVPEYKIECNAEKSFRLPFNTCTDTVYECDAFMEHV